MKNIICFLGLILISTTAMKAQNIDVAASKVTFKVTNRGAEVNGTMLNMKGEVQFDASNLSASSFKATVDPSTVNTNSNGRDKHLQKDDFFGTASFPLIHMNSKNIAAKDKGYVATAVLQVRDFSTEVEIPFNISVNADNQQVFEGTFKLNRLDYKLGEKLDEKTIGFDVEVSIYCVVSTQAK